MVVFTAQFLSERGKERYQQVMSHSFKVLWMFCYLYIGDVGTFHWFIWGWTLKPWVYSSEEPWSKKEPLGIFTSLCTHIIPDRQLSSHYSDSWLVDFLFLCMNFILTVIFPNLFRVLHLPIGFICLIIYSSLVNSIFPHRSCFQDLWSFSLLFSGLPPAGLCLFLTMSQ